MVPSRRAGLALTTLVLGLTACSGGGESDPSDTTAASGSQSASTPADLKEDVEALDDGYPTLEGGKPLPEDVTSDQLQGWVDSGRLPVAQTQSSHFETMINALDARREAPDVMLFGDSMTQQGIDPKVLGDELGDHTGSNVTAFDAATSKARWGVNRMIARHLVQTDKVPDVAVLVISTRASGDDPHYTEGVSTTPFSSVVEGCDREVEGWSAKDARTCRARVDDYTQRFQDSGAQVKRAQEGKLPQTSLRISDTNWLRSDGFMIHPSRSQKAVEKRATKRVEDRNPGLPEASEMGKKQFRDTVRLLEDNGATVIATEIPYSPAYQDALEKRYPGYDTRRQDASKALTEPAGVPLYPVDAFGDWWGDGDSRDEIHLSSQGAGEFSRQLLEDTPGFRDAVTEGLKD